MLGEVRVDIGKSLFCRYEGLWLDKRQIISFEREVDICENLADSFGIDGLVLDEDRTVCPQFYSVFPNHPEIARIKDSLYEMGAAYASMSGSGSTVYGIFRNPQENIEEKFEGCYCKCLKL